MFGFKFTCAKAQATLKVGLGSHIHGPVDRRSAFALATQLRIAMTVVQFSYTLFSTNHALEQIAQAFPQSFTEFLIASASQSPLCSRRENHMKEKDKKNSG